MTIMTRLSYVFNAIVYRALDRLGDKRLLLKQCFHDMATAITQNETHMQRLRACYDQIRRQEAECMGEIRILEQETSLTIRKGKDDLARTLIKRIKALTIHREELEHDRRNIEERTALLHTSLSSQQDRYQQLRLRTETLLRRNAHTQLTQIPFSIFPAYLQEPSEDEIELELLQRKEVGQGEGKA